VLRAAAQIFFVAKSEVRGWPVLGFIADQTGTMFIERKRTEAKRQEGMFADRLGKGHRLCFFPEGTSSDGMRVLPFKSTLFNAFLTDQLRDEMWVQPVTVYYHAAKHLRDSFYGWWGELGFGEHFLCVLGQSTGGTAHVVFHEAVRAADFADRKALSKHCEDEVRKGHDALIARYGVEVAAA
jgi:1-acyl-sn-glycerol-3-phosphate acyltransferase